VAWRMCVWCVWCVCVAYVCVCGVCVWCVCVVYMWCVCACVCVLYVCVVCSVYVCVCVCVCVCVFVCGVCVSMYVCVWYSEPIHFHSEQGALINCQVLKPFKVPFQNQRSDISKHKHYGPAYHSPECVCEVAAIPDTSAVPDKGKRGKGCLSDRGFHIPSLVPESTLF